MKQKIFPLALLSSIFVYAPLALANNAIIFPDDNKVANEAANEISQAGNTFGVELYQKLAQSSENKGKNIFFSNYSIHTILSALQEGAADQTAAEMQAALNLPREKEERNKGVQRLSEELTSNSQVKLSVVNGLWTGIDVNRDYMLDMFNYYKMPAVRLNFAQNPDGERVRINNWVSRNTEGKIKDLLPQGSIDNNTGLVLTNAVYFKGDWLKMFDANDTLPDNFSLTGGGTARVSMMNATFEKVKYKNKGDIKLLELPYKGKEVSMLIMLPEEGKIAELEQNLESVLKTELQEEDEVVVSLPKFKLETAYQLKDTLKNGFNMSTALGRNPDYTNINSILPLEVGGVFHKAFVEVDEKGTEAAAATGITVGVRSAFGGPKTFIADKPFIFAIKHNKLDTILFMGKVENPSSN